MRLRLTQRADKQLENIDRFLRREASDRVADQIAHAFDEAFSLLLEVPTMGKPSSLVPGMRERIVSSYRIFYEPHPKELVILRIYHQRRDITPDSFR